MNLIKPYWTPQYLADRARFSLREKVHPDWPWLTTGAVRFLELWLTPNDAVFEWGSGRSTSWLAQRVRSITAVEHDPIWFRVVQDEAARKRISNLDLRFTPNREADDGDSEYVAAINRLKGEFDLVIVDGMQRDRCAEAGVDRLRSGGLMIVDDVNGYIPLPHASRCPTVRKPQDGAASAAWARFADRVGRWRLIWTTSGLKDTAIWMKP